MMINGHTLIMLKNKTHRFLILFSLITSIS